MRRRAYPLGVVALALFLFVVAVSVGVGALNLGQLLAGILEALGRLA